MKVNLHSGRTQWRSLWSLPLTSRINYIPLSLLKTRGPSPGNKVNLTIVYTLCTDWLGKCIASVWRGCYFTTVPRVWRPRYISDLLSGYILGKCNFGKNLDKHLKYFLFIVCNCCLHEKKIIIYFCGSEAGQRTEGKCLTFGKCPVYLSFYWILRRGLLVYFETLRM